MSAAHFTKTKQRAAVRTDGNAWRQQRERQSDHVQLVRREHSTVAVDLAHGEQRTSCRRHEREGVRAASAA